VWAATCIESDFEEEPTMTQQSQKRGMRVPEERQTERVNRDPAEGGKLTVEEATKIQSRDLPAAEMEKPPKEESGKEEAA
jgi:hypothetical protein